MRRRRHDVMAFFDHSAFNGPTEAINGHSEVLRRNVLGLRGLTDYCWRALVRSGALHQFVVAL